ncbi:hypothetical protein H5410_026867 [Solanum commersonii]|uniref:F-box domain-containing protein n=1 Tax=Solanum commersonii TaxID=4109 RepID=A0A9J5Z0B3_SOLCO|nr:hypothetical protein H5410_026867 [Solanum commersonii]
MAYLPDEITMIILSILPVKSLLRFNLEDKQWRELEFPYNIYSVSEWITLHGRLHYKFHMFLIPEPTGKVVIVINKDITT